MSDWEEMKEAILQWRGIHSVDISKLLNDPEDGFKSLGELTYHALVLGLQDLNNAYETHKWHMEHDDYEGDDE